MIFVNYDEFVNRKNIFLKYLKEDVDNPWIRPH